MTPRHHGALPLPYGPMDALTTATLSRLSADLPAKDKNLIKGVCPKKGILNQIVQNIFYSLTNNLRSNGITYYSPEHEQYLVELVLRGCTAIESTVPPTPGNVHRRVESTCSGTEGGFKLAGDTQAQDHHRKTGGEEKLN